MAQIEERSRPGKAVLPLVKKDRVRALRPPPCSSCQSWSWWNGWRVVFVVVALAASAVERWEVHLPRAKCKRCRRSFTVRPAELYPHRQYQLDVVADVVARHAIAGESASLASAPAAASASSARRWTRWVAQIAKPSDLFAMAASVDPAAPVGVGVSTAEGSVAHQVLAGLEQLALGLGRAGVALLGRTGLQRVLHWQQLAHGVVIPLTGSSPSMALFGWQTAR